MLFNDETDIRSWVRHMSDRRARWVEHGRGGTAGLPDCWVPHLCSAQVHLELKLARANDGVLRYTVRADQRREIKLMIEDRVPVGLLLGIKGTDIALFVSPRARGALYGQIDWVGHEHEYRVLSGNVEPNDFWRGVDFIRWHPELPYS